MCSINCLYHRCSRNISHQKRIGTKATRITGAAVKQLQSNGAGACHVLLSSDMLAHVSNSHFTQEAAQCQQQCTWCQKHAPTYRGVHAQQAPEGCRCMCIRVVTAIQQPGADCTAGCSARPQAATTQSDRSNHSRPPRASGAVAYSSSVQHIA